MTDKQLRKLNRRELLEMLITQTRRVEQLEKQLEEANKKLYDKMIIIENSELLPHSCIKKLGVYTCKTQ